MADRDETSRAATGRAEHGRASARIAAVLALASFALAGCNANQAVNPSSRQNLAEIYPNYSAYNPIEYAQTSGFYGGR